MTYSLHQASALPGPDGAAPVWQVLGPNGFARAFCREADAQRHCELMNELAQHRGALATLRRLLDEQPHLEQRIDVIQQEIWALLQKDQAWRQRHGPELATLRQNTLQNCPERR